ncbi:N-6 DNA methylase [Thiomicrorhabdus aquaedulcis]|uniref:N-6 DNA methylase n=1 Tax=Thiomicrorhabdus aquaedulcis TaxID=2211106 RepID=UPI001E541697|nr:N-6 DNA methylase [Thiomicrorhabdus aquaedulcis]
MQEGFLRRGGYDQSVRKYLIDRSAVKLVITLNANQARQSQYNQVYLLMLVKNSARGHVNNDSLFDNEGVMFIDFREIQRLYDRKGTSLLNLTTLPFWDDEKYKQMTDHFNLGSVRIFKSNHEIVMNNCNLLIGNYQDKPGQNDFPNLAQATLYYDESAKHLEQCFEEFNAVLKKFKII